MSHQSDALHLGEIIQRIGHHLFRKDLLSSLTVCRSWHEHLLPQIWHSLVLPRRWRLTMAETPGFPTDPTTVRRHGHLVRSFNCGSNLQEHLHLLSPAFTFLTTLELEDVEIEALPILWANRATLKSVLLARDYELHGVRFVGLEKFLEAMMVVRGKEGDGEETAAGGCPSLESLRLVDIDLDGRVRDRHLDGPLTLSQREARAEVEAAQQDAIARVFYAIVDQLTRLDLIRTVIFRLPPSQAHVFYRLRTLSLIESNMSYPNQVQFISQCQYLTHLHLQMSRLQERLEPDEDVYHKYHGLVSVASGFAQTRISHLDISGSTLKDWEVASILEFLPGLISFKAQTTYIAEKTVQVLCENLKLEELDVVDGKEMKSLWLQQLLCSCSGLRKFSASEINVRDMVVVPPSSASDFPLSPSPSCLWVCLGLEELQMSITGISYTNPMEGQVPVYEQLARLTRLRVLSLGGSSMSTWFRRKTLVLTLGSGLGRLWPLKELRVFNFSYMDHSLTLAEVEWMMAHWTKLRVVIGTVRVGESGGEGGGGGGAGGGVLHRRWPHVEFSSS